MTTQPLLKFPGPLPAEILADILIRHLQQPPACALSLLCPEWSLCHRRNPRLEAILRTTRVDTYTLPLHPTTTSNSNDNVNHSPETKNTNKGTITTSFDHTPSDHLCLPHHRGPRTALDLSQFPVSLQRDVLRRWAGGSAVVASQREEPAGVGPLGAVLLEREVVEGMLLLREDGVVRLCPFGDDFFGSCKGSGGGYGDGRGEVVYGVDGGRKDVLPGGESDEYLYQRLRHLVVNTVPALAGVEADDLGTVPSVWLPGASRNLVLLAERLEYERRANLLMRWDALERLETLCLDLRGYSMTENRFLYFEDVVELAQGLEGKGLKLLVIAGLRSWRGYPGTEPLELDEVEGGVWDPEDQVWVSETGGRAVNWWREFRKAVRPGGRLVFVDREDGDELRLLRPYSSYPEPMLDY